MAYHNLGSMSSLLKTHSTKDIRPEDLMIRLESEISDLKSLEEAEQLFKKLKFLGLHFDPFASEISMECKQIMNQLGLDLYLENPYLVTNLLLRLLDKVEEKINFLKH